MSPFEQRYESIDHKGVVVGEETLKSSRLATDFYNVLPAAGLLLLPDEHREKFHAVLSQGNALWDCG